MKNIKIMETIETLEESEEIEYYNKFGERILFPEYYDKVFNKYGEEIEHPCPNEIIIED